MIKIDYLKNENRTVAIDDENIIGRCTYYVKDGLWHIDHTIVDKNYGGQGIAAKLVERLSKEAELSGVRIVPICSYAVKFYEKNKEYESIVVGS